MTQMTEKKKPLIILTGPTAVGKTAASIGLAKAIGGDSYPNKSNGIIIIITTGFSKLKSMHPGGNKRLSIIP